MKEFEREISESFGVLPKGRNNLAFARTPRFSGVLPKGRKGK
jgi:hypothetical protein